MELVRAISRRQLVAERPDNFVRTHLDQVHRPGPYETEVQKSPRPTLPGLPAPPACFLTPRARRVCPGRVLLTLGRGPHPAGRAQAAWRAAARRGRPVAATAGTRFCRFCREQATWRTPCSPCVYRAGPYRRRSVPRTPRSARGPRGGARSRVEASSRRPPSRPTWVCAQKLGFGIVTSSKWPGGGCTRRFHTPQQIL